MLLRGEVVGRRGKERARGAMTPRSRRVHVNKLPRERDNTKMERADESVSDENNRAGGKCRPRATEAPGGCASGALETVRE